MNILFWSGGKDAYLALHYFRESHPKADLMLLTTFNETDDTVPHQNIPIADIKEQANHLHLELLTVGLPAECPNDIYLHRIKKALNTVDTSIENLIFGDWCLQDIRDWREEVFGNMGFSCLFPIWEKNLQNLLPILFLQPITIEISAVNQEYTSLLKVGETFNQQLVSQLQRLNEIDPMGEQGEFHTKVLFHEPEKPQDQPIISPSK
ncbi:hypothetical protein [Fodinibius sp. Rm-B-1B1-1]|uniref:Dph6-related ATP pyrophosphatase n=1 Tax=Fodinibius alkaliphilus TaxID=3140241 RepID=UPI00315AD129